LPSAGELSERSRQSSRACSIRTQEFSRDGPSFVNRTSPGYSMPPATSLPGFERRRLPWPAKKNRKLSDGPVLRRVVSSSSMIACRVAARPDRRLTVAPP
jgi:hypothetical protein